MKRKIKGKISKRVAGAFKPLNIIGKKMFVWSSLKKLISSNKLRIKINVKKIKKVFKIFFEKSNIKKDIKHENSRIIFQAARIL